MLKKKQKQKQKNSIIKHLKVQQNWGGFIILSGYRGSHKITLQISQKHKIETPRTTINLKKPQLNC